MLYKFCAVLTKCDDGSFVADVPDLGCMTSGRDIHDAIDMIKDAAGLCLVVMEDEHDPIPNFRTQEEIKAQYTEPCDVIVNVEVDSDVVRAESDAIHDRRELLGAMNTIVRNLSDEDAYAEWIQVVPDQADDDALVDIACDESLFTDAVNSFKEIMRNYMKDGFCIGTKSY